ncbi:hypothetical protein, partial [Nonlabens xiamenensis]|uniref:hypothetical protein n=1 Tax=Nonlabens xiamenensis TaxID=2341043 RepID=UPI0013DE5FDE
MNTLLRVKLMGRLCAIFWVALLFPMSQFAQCPDVPISPQNVCDAAGFNFNDLEAFATDNGDGIRWYLNSMGGTPIPGTQLVQPGTYYADNDSGDCAMRPSLTVTFTVPPTGQTLDGIFCSNENPTVQTYIDEVLANNIPMGGNVEIYEDFGLSMQVMPGTALVGNDNYFIVFSDGTCRSQIETGSSAVFQSPAAPTPPATQEFCSDTNPTVADLDPGTTDNFNWYEALDSSNEPIPPALSPTEALVDGMTYYVQTDNFFCDSDIASVVVQIDDPRDPGTDGAVEYCEDGIPATDIDLFSLLMGTPESGGTWTGPLPTSNGDQGTVNLSGQMVGTYTFTYTLIGMGGCPDATSNVIIDIVPILSSGTVAATNPASFCESQAPAAFDLFSLLDNEDTGGVWTMGTASTDPVVPSTVDLSGLTPGTYDYTYFQNLNPNPCPEESTSVQVVILADPNAGTAVPTEFCENDLAANSPYDLFNSLDGSQDNNMGVWTDAMNNPIPNTVDITGFTVAGSPYSFTYTVDNGSCTDMETITIEVLPAPESGNYVGTPFQVCEDQAAANSPYDLFNLLDGTQDTNGTW